MSPRRSFLLPWFVSFATAFYRRGSVNDTAPFSNVTALTSTTAADVTPSITLTPSVSSQPSGLQLDNGRPSSEYGTAQSTSAGSSEPLGLISRHNATSLPPTPTASQVSMVNVTYVVSTIEQNATASSAYWANSTAASTRRSNATCTVNIPSASIAWWYPPTYSHSIATMTTRAANFSNTDSYTLITNTATFDAASAITTDYVCTWSPSYISEYDYTVTFCNDYTDKPTAASTAIAYQTAYAPFPPEGVIPVSDARLYDLYFDTTPIATTPISIAPNRTFIASSATPYVHFTAYEIESGNKTETVQLATAQVYAYTLEDLEHNAFATGPLPKDFLAQVPQSACDPGQLQAMVTVVVVVELVYENNPMLDPFIVHVESTALGFDDDGPVVVNNEGTSKGVPFTMGDPSQPTTAPRPPDRPEPVPTTRARGGDGSNEAQFPNNIPSPTQVTVGTIGTVPVVVGPSSVVIVGSQTLQPGGPAVVVDGVTPVSLAPSATAIVIGGTTSQLPQIFDPPAQNPVAPPVLTIGSSTLTPNAATQFFIAPGQTLTPGGTATVDGTFLAPSATLVVIGSNTQFLAPAATTPPQIVFGGSTFAALPPPGTNRAGSGPTFVVDGQTLAPGGQAIVASGTTLSLLPGGTSVVINGVTSAVANPAIPQPTITLGNTAFTASPGNTFVISDQTLTPGGPAITVSGTTVPLAPSASFVVINGETSSLANPAAQITAAPVLTIGAGIFRPLPGTGTSYLVDNQILTPGGSVVVADTTISLAPGATALIVNGQTSLITPSLQPVITNAPLLTIGGQTFTAVSGTTFVIGGQTLTPGGVITVDGTTISLAPGATELVVASNGGTSTTSALFPATTTRSASFTSLSPSAGASGRNGQVSPTGGRQQGAASSSVKANAEWVMVLGVLVLAFAF